MSIQLAQTLLYKLT